MLLIPTKIVEEAYNYSDKLRETLMCYLTLHCFTFLFVVVQRCS